MTNWCILRTAPSRTLPLAAALAEAGFAAWTPKQVRIVRVPRSKAKREVCASLTPTIVFADYESLPLLVALSRRPPSQADGVPRFSVFRHLDTYPRIADRELDPLRIAERRIAPPKQVQSFRPDDAVRCCGGGFDGLVGLVQKQKGRFVLVAFPGLSWPVKIEQSDLLFAAQAA